MVSIYRRKGEGASTNDFQSAMDGERVASSSPAGTDSTAHTTHMVLNSPSVSSYIMLFFPFKLFKIPLITTYY